MPRRPRHVGHRGMPAARAQRAAVDVSPAARLRALVDDGIVVAAAFTARDDLDRAAASTRRLGALTSGMWRALSRELDTAAERLDRSTSERMDDLTRRAAALNVVVDDLIAAGVATGHLEGHRERLETMMPEMEEDVRLLGGPHLLYGFSIEEPALDEAESDEEEDEPDELTPLAVRVWLFFWAAPLKPAGVTVLLGLPDAASGPEDMTVDLKLIAPDELIEPLGQAAGLSVDRLRQALSALGLACWTAHRADEDAEDADDAQDDADDLSHEEDQSLRLDDA